MAGRDNGVTVEASELPGAAVVEVPHRRVRGMQSRPRLALDRRAVTTALVTLPLGLESLLAHPLLRSVAEKVRASARPAARARVDRVSDAALRPDLLGRLFATRPAAAMLPPLTGKLGGLPYLESPSHWPDGYQFLGQLDFSDLRGAAVGAALPTRGALIVFVMSRESGRDGKEPFRWRWYPEPDANKAVRVEGPCRAGRARSAHLVSRSRAVRAVAPAPRAREQRRRDRLRQYVDVVDDRSCRSRSRTLR